MIKQNSPLRNAFYIASSNVYADRIKRSKDKNRHKNTGPSSLTVRFLFNPVWVLVWVSDSPEKTAKKKKASNPLGLLTFSWSC